MKRFFSTTRLFQGETSQPIPHARISCQSGVNFCLPAATQKKTVPPPGGTVLDIFLVQLYKKVCQSQPPTDFLFAPEIIFGTFSKPARHSAE